MCRTNVSQLCSERLCVHSQGGIRAAIGNVGLASFETGKNLLCKNVEGRRAGAFDASEAGRMALHAGSARKCRGVGDSARQCPRLRPHLHHRECSRGVKGDALSEKFRLRQRARGRVAFATVTGPFVSECVVQAERRGGVGYRFGRVFGREQRLTWRAGSGMGKGSGRQASAWSGSLRPSHLPPGQWLLETLEIA